MQILFILFLNYVGIIYGLKYCNFNILIEQFTINEVDKIKNCEILNGHLVIAYLTPNECESVYFPHLTEVKKFIIIVFNNCQRKDLHVIFPKLVIIRGQNLFKIYSLIIYQNEWPNLHFPRLKVVEKGEILIRRNRYSCNYRTINWDAFTGVYHNSLHVVHRINLQIPEICPAHCHSRCNGRCWSFDVCQAECSENCLKQGLYCSITNSTSCCHPECLGGCYQSNSTSLATTKPSNKLCVSCRNVIWNSACVRKCPSGYVETQSNVCIRKWVCTSQNMFISTIKNECVRVCPKNLVKIVGNLKYCMAKLSGNQIKHCGFIMIFKEKEIDSVKDCYSAEHVIIQLTGNYPDHDKLLRKLTLAFSKLRIIHHFLQVVKSSLKSLEFLSNLREISGKKAIYILNNVTVDITGNNDLTDLWIPADNSNFLIRHGKPRIIANRMLCPIKIKPLLNSFKSIGSITSGNNSDWSIINTTNGQLAICNIIPISVTKMLNITSISVTFQLQINKPNPEFSLANSTNQTNQVILSSKFYIQTMNNQNGECSKYRWKSRNKKFVCYSRNNKSNVLLLPLSIWPQKQRVPTYILCDIDNLEPATSYCAFFQFRFVNIHFAAQSTVLKFKTNRERPKSDIQPIKLVHLNYSSIHLSWQPPLLLKSKNTTKSLAGNVDQVYYLLSLTTNQRLQFSSQSQLTNQNEEALCLPDYTNKIKSLREKLKNQAQQNILRSETNKNNKNNVGENELKNSSKTTALNNENRRQCHSYCMKKCGKLSQLRDKNGVEDYINAAFRDKYQKMNEFDRDVLKVLTNKSSSQLIESVNKYISSDSMMILMTNQADFSNLSYFQDYIIKIRTCVLTKRYNNQENSLLCSWGTSLNFRTKSNPKADLIEPIGEFNESKSIIQLETNEKKDFRIITWKPPIRSNGEILVYSIRTRVSNKIKASNNISSKWTFCFVRPRVYIPNSNNSNATISSPSSSYPVRHYSKLSLSSFGGNLIDIQIMPITFSNNATIWSSIVTMKIGNYLTIKDNVSHLNNLIGKLIGSIVSVLVILLVGVILAVLYGRRKYLEAQAALSKVSYLYQPTPDVWSIDPDDLRLTDPIGKGSFGLVYSGYLSEITTPYKDVFSEDEKHSNAVKVAVKTLSQKAATVDDIVEFLAEASIMKQLVYSSHLVRLVGVYSGRNMIDNNIENSGSSLPMIIMEWMSMGDLAHYLSTSAINDGANEPAGKQAIEWAAEIADGMAFLADQKLVHRDLAGRNCLLSENLHVKVADFGFTRPINDEYYYRKRGQARMPVRWMAPESLKRALFTLKTDVWSYGIVLYEIATLGSLPYTGMNHEQVIDFVVNRGRLEIDELKFPSCLLDMIVWCLSYLENERPTFLEILDFLMPYLHNYYENIGQSDSFNARFESEYFYHQITSSNHDCNDDNIGMIEIHEENTDNYNEEITNNNVSYSCATEIV